MATIEVYSKVIHQNFPLFGNVMLPVEHTYLLYTDDLGNKRIIRGGPTILDFTPDINGHYDPQNSTTLHMYEFAYQEYEGWTPYDFDFPTDGEEHIPTTIATGSETDLDQIWDYMKTRAESIEGMGLDYQDIDRNSNTATHAVIEYADAQMGSTLKTNTGWAGPDPTLSERAGEPVVTPAWDDTQYIGPTEPPKSLAQQSFDAYMDWDIVAAIPGALIETIKGFFNTASGIISPLVLDLTGTGIDLTELNEEGAVYWDIDNDGVREASGWIGEGMGLLSVDLNDNGTIDDHSELFGDQGGAANGFESLAAYDSNTDGVIDDTDADWADLLVWVDENGDAVSQEEELHTLDDLEITSIDLGYSNVNYDISGNTIKQESTFQMDGQTRTIVDAWFQYDNVHTVYGGNVEPVELTLEALSLPNQRGYGALPDLVISMSLDEDLLDMVEEVAGQTPGDLFDPEFGLTAKIDAIMFQWAGVQEEDPDPQTNLDDERRLLFLEKFLDQDFNNVVHGNNAVNFFNAWNLTFSLVATHILGQSVLNDLFGNPVYNLVTDSFSGGDWGGETTLLRFVPPMIPAEESAVLNDSGYSDIYVLTPGDSTDPVFTINEGVDDGYDALLLGGVDAEDVRLWTGTNGTMHVQYTAEDQVDIYGYYSSSATDVGSRIEQILFDDGTVWDLTDGLTMRDTDDAHTIYATGDADVISGEGGDDTIYTFAGNDTLDGGAGSDYLSGGTGNDTYVFTPGFGVATTAAADQVYEAVDEGENTVLIGGDLDASDFYMWLASDGFHMRAEADADDELVLYAYRSGVDWDLNSRIISVTFDDESYISFSAGLTLNDTDDAHTGFGMSYADTIHGGGGNDDIYALGGDDYVYGDADGDNLSGGDGSDHLYGGTGNDVLNGDDGTDYLDGGSGSDIMSGGEGDDYYIIDDLGDNASYDYIGSNHAAVYVDGWELPNASFTGVTLMGNANISTTGTSLANLLTGNSGNNTLRGMEGEDTLDGGGGNDRLDGGTDADTMTGGNGDDTYVIDDSGDVVIEYGSEGSDTVESGITYTLLTYFENLTLTGTGNIDGTGNSVANTITGNSGDNTLSGGSGDDKLGGGAGTDTLTGGGNADTFVFKAASAYSEVDTVTDFSTGQNDVLDFRDLLTPYNPGTDVITDWLRITDVSSDSKVEIDQDGTGGTYGWTQVATLTGITGLTDEAALVSNGTLLVA